MSWHLLPAMFELYATSYLNTIYKESLSPHWQFLTLYTLSKLVMTEWHKAAWLLQPFCIFATMHNHCKFYSSSTMTFNDLTEHQEPHTFPTLLPLTATVGFGSIAPFLAFFIIPLLQEVASLLLYSYMKNHCMVLFIPWASYLLLSSHFSILHTWLLVHHPITSFRHRSMLLLRSTSCPLLAKQWFFRGQHLSNMKWRYYEMKHIK